MGSEVDVNLDREFAEAVKRDHLPGIIKDINRDRRPPRSPKSKHTRKRKARRR